MNSHVETPNSLRAFLDDALDRHADAPADVALALRQRAPALPAGAEAAEAIRLAEHVALGHLADAGELAAFLAALPPALADADVTAPSWQRARWALAQVQAPADGALSVMPADGALPVMPADAPRWRALQNVVLALAGQGRCGEAAALLAADEAAARAHGAGEAGTAYAATANNIAGHLQTDGAARDPDRDALMVQAAATARRAWGVAGDWQHVERAEYRLALCQAAAGNGSLALRHARLCLAGCEAAGDAADAVEHFFGHEALARAHLAAGQQDEAAAAALRMDALLASISEADGLRAWCAQALAGLPR